MGDHQLFELRPETGSDHVPNARDVVVTVAPSAGGRIAQLEVDGRPVLVGGDHASHPAMWGAFPMAPWAGRVRSGRFRFDGTRYDLHQNLPPHAIHGTTFDRRWTTTFHDPQSIAMEIELDWPFGGRATQFLTVRPDALVCELTVHARDAAMPAEIGWHPWFVKPDSISFAPVGRYVRDTHGIAIDEVVIPDLTAGPFDDCFVNTAAVVLHHGRHSLTLESDCDHWVLYDEPHHATCIEPQSGPPDAFTIRPRRLSAGDSLRRTFRLSW
ncbi:aldose 1-epimerase [soil metagenome]